MGEIAISMGFDGLSDPRGPQLTDILLGVTGLSPRRGSKVYLYQLLGTAVPRYLHVPVACDAAGEKFSKQRRARALDGRASESLEWAFAFLGRALPGALRDGSPREMPEWGTGNWASRGTA